MGLKTAGVVPSSIGMQSSSMCCVSISFRHCDRGDYVSRRTDGGTEEHDRRVEADGL